MTNPAPESPSPPPMDFENAPPNNLRGWKIFTRGVGITILCTGVLLLILAALVF